MSWMVVGERGLSRREARANEADSSERRLEQLGMEFPEEGWRGLLMLAAQP